MQFFGKWNGLLQRAFRRTRVHNGSVFENTPSDIYRIFLLYPIIIKGYYMHKQTHVDIFYTCKVKENIWKISAGQLKGIFTNIVR